MVQGAIALFASPRGVTMMQWTDRLAPSVARSYIPTRLADARVACPRFTSRTPHGGSQLNAFGGLVAFPELADEAAALRARIRPAGAPWMHVVGIMVRAGDHLTLVSVISQDRMSDAFVRTLARRAAGRLEAATP